MFNGTKTTTPHPVYTTDLQPNHYQGKVGYTDTNKINKTAKVLRRKVSIKTPYSQASYKVLKEYFFHVKENLAFLQGSNVILDGNLQPHRGPLHIMKGPYSIDTSLEHRYKHKYIRKYCTAIHCEHYH